MKEETKRRKLAELLGIDMPTAPTSPRVVTERENRSREAEAVLEFVQYPTTFRMPTCSRCGNNFAVNRSNVSYCSDKCRAETLAEMGIQFNWDKDPASRWYVVQQGSATTAEPLVVPPEFIKFIVRALKLDLNSSSFDTGSPTNEVIVSSNLNVDIDVDELLAQYG